MSLPSTRNLIVQRILSGGKTRFEMVSVEKFIAAVMRRVTYASVFIEIHITDANWVSCIAHCPNNTMKNVFETSCYVGSRGTRLLQNEVDH